MIVAAAGVVGCGLLLLSPSPLQCVLWCQSLVWFLQVWLFSSNTWQETCRVLCWAGSLLCSLSCLMTLFSYPGVIHIWHLPVWHSRRNPTFHSRLQIWPLLLSHLNLECLHSFETSWVSTVQPPQNTIQISERAMKLDQRETTKLGVIFF